MISNKFFKKLSPRQTELSSRILDIVINRVLKRAYLCFSKEAEESMDRIFLSGSDTEKEGFIKKNIPNFKELFEEEVKKIEEEIKTEIKKEA